MKLDGPEKIAFFMSKASDIAVKNVSMGNGGPFGALVVQEGIVIGAGGNRVTTENDPTAHAEIVAIREACSNKETFDLTGCEIFSSCEPCPMCLSAIYWARIKRVYYANDRWDASKIGFDDAEIYAELSKGHNQGSIEMIQVPDKLAKVAFSNWNDKRDKILY